MPLTEPEPEPRRGAVVFDRDGVLNVDTGYAHRPEQIRWIEGAIEAVAAVNAAGLYAFVATNQSGIARGYYGEADVVALHDWMNAELAKAGARIDAFVYSPYHPEATVDAYRREAPACRKPAPGMILDLLARFPVDPARTVMIGDNLTDIQAAQAAGVQGVLFEGGSLLDAVRPVIARLAAQPLSPKGRGSGALAWCGRFALWRKAARRERSLPEAAIKRLSAMISAGISIACVRSTSAMPLVDRGPHAYIGTRGDGVGRVSLFKIGT